MPLSHPHDCSEASCPSPAVAQASTLGSQERQSRWHPLAPQRQPKPSLWGALGPPQSPVFDSHFHFLPGLVPGSLQVPFPKRLQSIVGEEPALDASSLPQSLILCPAHCSCSEKTSQPSRCVITSLGLGIYYHTDTQRHTKVPVCVKTKKEEKKGNIPVYVNIEYFWKNTQKTSCSIFP